MCLCIKGRIQVKLYFILFKITAHLSKEKGNRTMSGGLINCLSQVSIAMQVLGLFLFCKKGGIGV